MSARQRVQPGIYAYHSTGCRSRSGGRCGCRPTYTAEVYSKREGRKLRSPSLPSLSEARAWRSEAHAGMRKGTVQARSATTVAEAAEALIDGMRDGTIRNKSGDVYKPSNVRGYHCSLELYVMPALGHLRLSDVRSTDVQALADELLRTRTPSTVRNIIMPLRVIYRRAKRRGEVAVNPTSDLELPKVDGRRERVVAPGEATRLVGALPEPERALWMAALYAGLRLGELRALRWQDVDLAANLIRVERSWDPSAGAVAPKSAAGRRRVPIIGLLRSELRALHLRQGRRDGLVFGRTADRPFNDKTVRRVARRAWDDAELEPITPHEARHACATFLIAAGVHNPKTLTSIMGHSSVTVTIDRYGHLLPGSEDEAGERLSAFLERAAAATGTTAGANAV